MLSLLILMTSFGYRLNPRFAIKECSSCGALYTRNYSCSKENVEDKILVPKPPKNCVRCAKCGHPNIFKSSDDSTNVVNAPRDPVVVKQDHGVNPPHIDECCCECVCQIFQKKQEEKRIEEEQAASARYWKIPACCDDDDDYDSAITPILSTEETEDSLSMGDEHLDTIPTQNELLTSQNTIMEQMTQLTSMCELACQIVQKKQEEKRIEEEQAANARYWKIPAYEVIKSSVEDIDPIPREISSGSTTTHSDISLLDYEAFYFDDDHVKEISSGSPTTQTDISPLNDNPTQSFDCKTKSSSTSFNSLLEETNTFHNSLPEFKNFYFDLGEISSGSTTTHSDISLSEYDLFIFDLTHEEFVDELAHIISPSEYDRFHF
uniref:Uncharacterized protein n=1 Tax=Tanacetum cinerariifolium TaxID=118510 RepID=A0A6L2L556_TANCI|nr:hypothetical protein [Tanacetum cinerariifolium]